MSEKKNVTVHEPLFHLTKRASIAPGKAWLIRLATIVLGLLVCGVVAFVLIDKLNQNPERIGDFYYSFIKGSFSTKRKLWKFMKNVAILQCISLAVTPAFRMRFWNCGAEGQALVGGLAAMVCMIELGGKVPDDAFYVK